jgi:TRAP-type C4-dicarboxylate transport system permease small subunit
MYLSQILQYLILPAFILLAWFAIQYAMTAFEKKSSEEEQR